MRLEEVGAECKAYWECVTEKKKDCVARQDCPYADCGRRCAWYWGWYYREEGKKGTTSIPFGDAETACPAIPIRRFYCPKCGRTFSWRPRFLVFGRQYAAAAYELAFHDWVSRRPPGQDPRWWLLSAEARAALFRWLRVRLSDLLARIHGALRRWGALLPTVGDERLNLWNGVLQLTEVIGPQESPRLPFHFLCLALARHPYGSCYSLGSA